jgi:hypothetical protein
MVRVRLTKKPARVLNGIDVTNVRVGDVLHLSHSAAYIMIAERWAEPVHEDHVLSQPTLPNLPGNK